MGEPQIMQQSKRLYELLARSSKEDMAVLHIAYMRQKAKQSTVAKR